MKMVISVKFWIFISVNMYVLREVCCSDSETGGDSMRCSVFDFEQKLLEKLVRMEMKMNTMEMKMDTMELKMDSTEMKLDNLEMKMNTTEMKMDSMEMKMSSMEMKMNTTEMNMDSMEMKMSSMEMKMNTTEMKMDAMEMKMDSMELKMSSMEMKMNTTEMKMDSMEMIMSSMEMKMNTVEMTIEKMDREITSFKQSSKDEMNSLKTDVLRLENAVSPVVFEASGVTKDSDLKDQVLKFDKHVSFNTGGGYNKTRGIFKAPSAGTYVFELQLCLEPKKRVLAEIAVDNSPIKMIDYYNTGSGYSCISGSGLSEMGSESEAFVRCTSKTDDGDVLFNHEKYTSFSGRKLV